jgi:hypothetical protein
VEELHQGPVTIGELDLDYAINEGFEVTRTHWPRLTTWV